MRRITLANGRGVTLIDDEDAELVAPYRWRLNGTRYAQASPYVDGKQVSTLMHRLILGAPPGVGVDHINRDGLDNRRANLRLGSQTQNLGNVALRSNNASGFKGVYWHAGGRRWKAELWFGRQYHYLGYYDTAEAAAHAYDQAARERFGEFAWLNFPEEESA